MATENETQPKEKKSKAKLVIIILIVVVLLLSLVIGYFVLTGNKISDVMKVFEKEEEYTLLMDDFIVNLANDNQTASDNYLKIQVALMYTDDKHAKVLSENVSKIRDVIIRDLRKNSALDLASTERVDSIKSEICDNVNEALGNKIIEKVYFSDLLIQ